MAGSRTFAHGFPLTMARRLWHGREAGTRDKVMMRYIDHSVTRRAVACRLTLAELELLRWIVLNMSIGQAVAGGSVRVFATNDNDRPAAERMRVEPDRLLDELTRVCGVVQRRIEAGAPDDKGTLAAALARE